LSSLITRASLDSRTPDHGQRAGADPMRRLYEPRN
jgi:hypothetical protein